MDFFTKLVHKGIRINVGTNLWCLCKVHGYEPNALSPDVIIYFKRTLRNDYVTCPNCLDIMETIETDIMDKLMTKLKKKF